MSGPYRKVSSRGHSAAPRRRGGAPYRRMSPSTKRTAPMGRTWNVRSDQSRTGARDRARQRTRIHSRIPSHTPADERIQSFYQRKQDENTNPNVNRGVHAWVKKEPTSAKPAESRSFSDVVKTRQAAQRMQEVDNDENETKNSLPLAKDETVTTDPSNEQIAVSVPKSIPIPKPSEQQEMTAALKKLIAHESDSPQKLMSQHPHPHQHQQQQQQHPPPPATIQSAPSPSSPVKPTRSTMNPVTAQPYRQLFLISERDQYNSDFSNGINAAVTEHNNALRSQILDLQKRNQQLQSELALSQSELTRLKVEHSKEQRETVEQNRQLVEKFNKLAHHVQRQGFDPESFEALTNTSENTDRMLFLQERLLQSHEQSLAFKRRQRELLDRIQGQRVILKQMVEDVRSL